MFREPAVVIKEFDALLFVTARESVATQDRVYSCVEVHPSARLNARWTTERPEAASVSAEVF